MSDLRERLAEVLADHPYLSSDQEKVDDEWTPRTHHPPLQPIPRGGPMSTDDLRCLTCGTDNHERECPDWCPRMQGACSCGSPLCGDCMRRAGTSNSGFGHGRRRNR